jgi:hypothetical protein
VGDDSVSTRQAAVKKYVVTLSAEEREWLEALIRTGKHSARKLLRARILLKADASEAGEALTDSQIAVGLHTSLETVARIRQQLVEDPRVLVEERVDPPVLAVEQRLLGALP